VSWTKNTLLAVVVLVLTFVAGMAAGIFAAHMHILHGGPGAARFPRAMVNRLDRRLDLTDAQRKQVEEIVNRRHANIDEVWGGVRPRVRAEIEAANEEIARVLTPEQRARFEKMRMRMLGHRR
jgi:Spy/CpxP family protein refolding chaperone